MPKQTHQAHHSFQKDEVKSRLEAEKLKRAHEFADLYKNNPAKASALVSSFFKRQKTFQLALRDDLTGEDLSGPKAAEFVAADLLPEATQLQVRMMAPVASCMVLLCKSGMLVRQ